MTPRGDGSLQEYANKRNREICAVSRYGGFPPPFPPENAVAQVLKLHIDLDENTKSLILRELQRRGEKTRCLKLEATLSRLYHSLGAVLYSLVDKRVAHRPFLPF